MKRRFWFFLHNAIAHPLLITGTGWSEAFHDYTAREMEPQLPIKPKLSPEEGQSQFWEHTAWLIFAISLYHLIVGDNQAARYEMLSTLSLLILSKIQLLKK